MSGAEIISGTGPLSTAAESGRVAGRREAGGREAAGRRAAADDINGARTQWSAADAREWLRPPTASDHKVSRGVLGARIGSAKYPGAAVLGVTAAWRTGIGMVRYLPPFNDAAPEFGLPTPAAAVLAARPETLFVDGDCDAWLLGSGTDPAERSFQEEADLARLHLGATPLVVDAGALSSSLDRSASSAPAVLTPHGGEFLKLWDHAGFGHLSGEAAIDPTIAPVSAGRLAARLSATVLLKGSITLVASPSGGLITVGPATPWLATAGTGDVLAGILGALVARHSRAVLADPEVLAPLAATAALVHDLAARIAAGDDAPNAADAVGAPITALEVAEAIPAAIARINTARAHHASAPRRALELSE